ncbi:MAG: hypothetical protein M1827_007739 [Pycnora praestabilis]|nr:MAG: hypothetical protein M1827_007739 [Pycnora praestabilis]
MAKQYVTYKNDTKFLLTRASAYAVFVWMCLWAIWSLWPNLADFTFSVFIIFLLLLSYHWCLSKDTAPGTATTPTTQTSFRSSDPHPGLDSSSHEFPHLSSDPYNGAAENGYDDPLPGAYPRSPILTSLELSNAPFLHEYSEYTIPSLDPHPGSVKGDNNDLYKGILKKSILKKQSGHGHAKPKESKPKNVRFMLQPELEPKVITPRDKIKHEVGSISDFNIEEYMNENCNLWCDLREIEMLKIVIAILKEILEDRPSRDELRKAWSGSGTFSVPPPENGDDDDGGDEDNDGKDGNDGNDESSDHEPKDRITHLERTIADQQKMITELKAKDESSKVADDSDKATIESLRAEKAALKATAKCDTLEIKILKIRNTERTALIEDQTRKLDQQEKTIASLRASHGQDVCTIEQQRDDALYQLEIANMTVKDLRAVSTQENSVIQLLQNADARIQTLEAEVTVTSATIATLQNERDQGIATIQDKEYVVRGLEKQIEEIASEPQQARLIKSRNLSAFSKRLRSSNTTAERKIGIMLSQTGAVNRKLQKKVTMPEISRAQRNLSEWRGKELNKRAKNINELKDLVRSREKSFDGVVATLKDRGITHKNLEILLSDKEEAIKDKEALLSHRNVIIKDLEATQSEQFERIQELTAEVAKRDARIQELQDRSSFDFGGMKDAEEVEKEKEEKEKEKDEKMVDNETEHQKEVRSLRDSFESMKTAYKIMEHKLEVLRQEPWSNLVELAEKVEISTEILEWTDTSKDLCALATDGYIWDDAWVNFLEQYFDDARYFYKNHQAVPDYTKIRMQIIYCDHLKFALTHDIKKNYLFLCKEIRSEFANEYDAESNDIVRLADESFKKIRARS